MIDFNESAFKRWQEDFDDFNYGFRSYCFQQFRVYSIHVDFVPGALQQIHRRWVERCEVWLNQETHPTTKKLSHIKRAALLLHALTSIQFLGNFQEHEYDEEQKYDFRGTADQFNQSKQDLIDAREAVLALDFVLNIIHYFESNRIDREEPFSVRLTMDMRHDILSYILSGEPQEKALYLILKALYLRHTRAGAAN
ncbi:hypothetical protein [Roseospira navarrensis]|uniref:Uncharacterized protein n=1 Tax=Roseospira navarrensis TaxID=140058 RepID=A0A7X2D403_9PROT|nr:hypothetical protein [Roseospira navarrensis]MQX37929.1 hypothetical protein [Roseospira navarrensis]